jgi:hypothetical protein
MNDTQKFSVGRVVAQGSEIADEHGVPVAVVYGVTEQEARDRAKRIVDLLNEHGL